MVRHRDPRHCLIDLTQLDNPGKSCPKTFFYDHQILWGKNKISCKTRQEESICIFRHVHRPTKSFSAQLDVWYVVADSYQQNGPDFEEQSLRSHLYMTLKEKL